MAQGVKQLSELRVRLELMLSIPASSAYVDSTAELEDINSGYELTAYAYDWPHLLDRVGIIKVANLNRYSLPSNFRKARTVKLDNVILTETELEFLKKTRDSFVIDQIQEDIILHEIPSAASTPYTLSNAESAGNATTIELDTVSGLSQHDEIWIDSASGTDEFCFLRAWINLSGVSSSNRTTKSTQAKAAKMANAKITEKIEVIRHYTRRFQSKHHRKAR